MKKISGYIPDELYNDIVEISVKDNRKVAPVITILLQQAVKERKRKRDGRKIKSNQ